MIAKVSGVGVAAVLAALLAPSPANSAQPAGRDDARLAACILEASEGRQWLEKTLWGLRDQEAGWIGAQVKNRNGTHDLGPLQVNSWWVPKLAKLTGRQTVHIRWWLVHDPCFNVRTARWIFLSALSETRDYWKAVGVYHSPSSRRQSTYAANVANRMRARFGAQLFSRRAASSPSPSHQPHPAR